VRHRISQILIFHPVKFNPLLIRGVYQLDDQLNQSLICDSYQAEYGKEYHSPPWRPPENRTLAYQDTSTSQCSPYSVNGDMCNSEQVDGPDIVPVVSYSTDHDNLELFSVKTEPPDVRSQDVSQRLLGVPDGDHDFRVDQCHLCLDAGISVDNLDSSTGDHIVIVDEANGSTGVSFVQQEAFDNQACSSSVHDKHSQIKNSFHSGTSFSSAPVFGTFSSLLNTFSPYIRFTREEQSPVNGSFGNISPSNEFVLPGTNFQFPLFNISDESPFTVLDFPSSGASILPNESAEYQYGYGVNGFPTAICPSRLVPCAPVECSDTPPVPSSHRGGSDLLPAPSSHRGGSEFSLPLLSSSPITSDQATVSIRF
jgi:hypothetical protein